MSKPVVLIAEELSPATVDALGPDFDVRSVDGTDVLAYRAMFPVGVAMWMLQPGNCQQRFVFKSLEPHGAPALAHQLRIWRSG